MKILIEDFERVKRYLNASLFFVFLPLLVIAPAIFMILCFSNFKILLVLEGLLHQGTGLLSSSIGICLCGAVLIEFAIYLKNCLIQQKKLSSKGGLFFRVMFAMLFILCIALTFYFVFADVKAGVADNALFYVFGFFVFLELVGAFFAAKAFRETALLYK